MEKAQKWRELGQNPYGNGYVPTHLAEQVHKAHGHLTAEQIEQGPRAVYSLAGRIIAVRSFGKAAFVKLRDRTGEIQLHVKKDALDEKAFELFKLSDVGDFVGAEGSVFRSKTGELSLSVTKYVPLTKSLRPMPEKWHGLTDTEVRYRQRYLDLMSNLEVRDVFLKRTRLVKFIRHFLDARDFVEVETPMMHPLVSGAAITDCP